MMEPSANPGVVSSVSHVSPISAMSSDGVDNSSLPRADCLLHPVSNKSVPSTAIIIRDIVKVSTPGTVQEGGSDSSDSDDQSEVPAPKVYMTKKRKMEAKVHEVQDKKLLYQKASDEYLSGKFNSIHEASKHYGLVYSCLHRYLVHGDSFNGKGRKSQVLTAEEEQKIVNHVIYRQQIGCGMTFPQLQLLIQEVLVAVIAANPDRTSPYAANGHYPNRFFTRRFAERYNLTLRATMEISKGRQILSLDDLVAWQKDTEAGLVNNEVVAECFNDAGRVFNQDETSVQVGTGSSKVLAVKGTKVLYNFSGSSREHVTASYIVSASGGCVPVRIIYKGVRNMAAQHLKNFPTTGQSGSWKFGVTANGYVTREAFIDILKDLDEYLEEKNVKRPVILFMDGQKGHISLEAAAFCKLKQIQPWLLRANMTHLLQPLDLTFFSALKKKLSQLAHAWHADPKNTGQSLAKYSIMGVLYEATETCLSNSSLIPNGFKRAGLFPWDPSAPDRTKLLPGSVYASSATPLATAVSLAENTNTVDTAHLKDTSPVANALPSTSAGPPVDNTIPISTNIPIASPSTADNDYTLPPPPSMADDEDFNPPLSSTICEGPESSQESSPYWYGKTQICPGCDQRIMKDLFSIHSENCGSVKGNECVEMSTDSSNLVDMSGGQLAVEENRDVSAPTEEITLSSIPSYTLDDRTDQLEKFEVLLLTKAQVKEFNEMFIKKEFTSIKEPLYKAWLQLKFAAAGTESEAIDRLLSSKVAKNVQKRKNKRKDNQPSGPARYDPSSSEWVSILTEQKENKKTAAPKKRKGPAMDAKNGAKKQKTSNKENISDHIQ